MDGTWWVRSGERDGIGGRWSSRFSDFCLECLLTWGPTFLKESMPEIEWETFLTSAAEGNAGTGMVVTKGGSFAPTRPPTGPGNAEERDIDLRFAFFNISLAFL